MNITHFDKRIRLPVGRYCTNARADKSRQQEEIRPACT